MANSINPRELVLGVLMDITENHVFSNIAINNLLKKYQYLEKRDRAFISRLTEGTIENLIRIDYIINQFSKTNTEKMKPVIRNILRMGVYQLFYMDNTIDAAVCNEAVNLTIKKGFKDLKGFVNGVLRNIARNRDSIIYPNEQKEPIKYLSVWYSVPEWILVKWLKTYEYNIVKNICNDFLMNKKTCIRCNLNKATKEEIKEQLQKQGITVSDGNYLRESLWISNYNYIDKIEGFREGLFSIQDESSMLVSQIAAPKEGDYIIDVCAAPGGKSTHLAEMLNGTGYVSARDVSESKIQFIEENIKRLGLLNVETKVWDAMLLDKESIGKADIVIVDAPCSGLGVIGKKMDIKYNVTEEGIRNLTQVQKDILDMVHKYVKYDGVLIYSTCTINNEENIDNILWFTNRYSFELESIDQYINPSLINKNTNEGYINLIPGIHKTDGFFIARLRKKK